MHWPTRRTFCWSETAVARPSAQAGPARHSRSVGTLPHAARFFRACFRPRLVSPGVVTSTAALSTGWLGDSVPVKWPTDTGSLAGNVAFSPSSSSSSRCRFSFPPFDVSRRASRRSSASACATSSGSSPSSLLVAICMRSHASFSAGVPGTCAMMRSAMRGSGRPSSAADRARCGRLSRVRNIGQSRNFGSAAFLGSATALHSRLQKRHPSSILPHLSLAGC